MDLARFRKVLTQTLVGPAVASVIVAALLVAAIWRLNATMKWVDHSDRVTVAAGDLLNDMLDEETGIRGFLETRNRAFLQPYFEAERKIPDSFAQVSAMIQDNAEQTERLQNVRADFDQWRAAESLAIAKPPRTNAELLAQSLDGKRRMDAIREQLAQFVQEEERLRTEREARAAHALKIIYWLIVCSVLLLILIFGTATVRAWRLLTAAFSDQLRHADAERSWLETTIRSIGDAIIACDADGTIALMNAEAERCTGWREADAIGQPLSAVFRIIDEASGVAAENPVDKARREGTVVGLANHTMLIQHDGNEIPIGDSAAPVKGNSGAVIGTVLVFRDLSDEKRAQASLLQTERLATAGRLAATVAHEINNPLEAVTNLIYLAQSESSFDEAKAHLTRADQELQRIAHVTRQTLGFYRDSVARQEFRPSDLVSELVGIFSGRIETKRIRVALDVDASTTLIGRAGDVRQVLANLIANSLDALPIGGLLRIRVRRCAEGVRFTVADSGTGIPGHLRKKVFEAFFTTKTAYGTGLGLWVSKSLVERNGGRMQVKSWTMPATAGTVVSFVLPQASASAAADD
jgi:PAS domain S-box-containing protein